ncbi:MFS transporter [Sphingomonas sp. 37zxx]|uniref:MFS transporter n=1 Tax=Sphingomonas sp. 37zxx TaxID=1550073 RepID=UPI00068A95DF|nr:MFS transporter [Sphingomonas sp. 37zxx]
MQNAESPYPGRGRSTYIVGVLFLGWLFAFIDRQIIGLLVPALKASMGLSDLQVSLLQGIAFASVYALAGLPIGRIADRTDRRRLIALGVAVWSIATIGCGFCTSFGQLFAARMCVGLGEACIAPAAVSLLADAFRAEHRGKAIAFMQLGAPLGTSVALFGGGLLLTSLASGTWALGPDSAWQPWQILFLVAGAPGLIVALLVLTLAEPPRRSSSHVHLPGDDSAGRLFRYLGEHRATFGFTYMLYACIFVMGYAVTSWAPTVLMRVHGMSPKAAGGTYAAVILFCSASAYALSGVISDMLCKRRPGDGRILLPLFLIPVELVAMTVYYFATSTALTIAALAVSGLSLGMASTSGLPALQEIAPNRLRGQMVALYMLVASLVGLGLGPTLVGLITDLVYQDEMRVQQSSALVALAAGIVALVVAQALPRHYRQTRALQTGR